MKKTIIAITAVLMMLSCSKDNATHNTYFILDEGSFDLTFEFYGGTQSFAVYSDYDRWTYKVSYEIPTEEEWVKIWPYEAEKNSRFSLKVFPNDCAASRRATVGIMVEGKQMQQINIEQGGEI